MSTPTTHPTGVQCHLRVTPAGALFALTFELHNDGAEPRCWTVEEPLTTITLRAVDADRHPVDIEQPAADHPVRLYCLDLPPGASTRLPCAIRLRCDPDAPPDDPFVWIVRHPPRGLTLHARLDLDGPPLPPCHAELPAP